MTPSASPGILLEMQYLRPHPRPTDSESIFRQDHQVIHMHDVVWEALIYLTH